MRPALLLLCACLAASAQAPYERILNSASQPENWLTYSGNYQGHRFSRLRQLTPENVSRLQVKWVYQFRNPRTEVSPLVVDGVMYLTAPQFAAAVDARTGRNLWTWERPLPADLQTIGFDRTNRGAAILDGTLYVGTLDDHLIALDAKSGAQRWDAQVADYRLGHCITVAPLAIRGKVLIGISGGEAGIRGFVDAYEARTGRRLWRFWTIPGPGQPGHETWRGDDWKTGGGSTWVTGSYDPELNLVFWGVGNPGPDMNGDVRPGDNLYTCSFVALDADTGKLRWHFQFTPHDTHDWDSTHVPVLIDATFAGRPRKLIANANRNGFYYLLDRTSGKFLLGTPYAKQTWAEGLDERGRPRVIPNTEPSEKGTLVWPSLQGGTNWFSPSYSPETGLFYVAVREMGAVYYKREANYKPGTFFPGGGETALSGDRARGAVRALEATTGKRVWEFLLHRPTWAGVMATAGGLVFGGSDEGNFFALDARTGKPLWDFQTGGPITANPVSFLVDGKQCVAIAADRVLLVFGL
ncbi:MAG TPA: PQQ-dependent dehydrogenase, methanol/ethanol family [Bryobacteraceae bacterium]|nr:PQQ-dependent dehydrogenase, methanol/ethanol family [Bryobacteraceae bacterium]